MSTAEREPSSGVQRPKILPAASTKQYVDPGVQASSETQTLPFNCPRHFCHLIPH